MAEQTVARRYLVVSEVTFGDGDEQVTSYREVTRQQHQKIKDRMRTACQAPISSEKSCVMYRVNGKEKRTPWFYREETIQRALKLMQARYGERQCGIYVD